MPIILLRRVCPFCDQAEEYAGLQNVRRHIQRIHGYLLPTRSKNDPQVRDSKQYSAENLEKYPNATIRSSCPSCSELYDDKSVLKAHVEEQHFIFTPELQQRNSDNDWKVNGTNVTEKFDAFKKHCMENSFEYADIDSHFNQLLAISSILVLQRRNLYGSIPTTYFDSKQLKDIHISHAQDLSWRKTFQCLDSALIKDILMNYRDNLISNFDARFALMKLADAKNGPVSSVILAIESLLPALKDLDLPQRSESELLASFVHPLIQSLFALHSPTQVAHCSNVLPTDDVESTKRPDYVVDVYEQYHFAYTSCYGEVKTEKSSETSKIMDFCRLSMFAKIAMDKYKLSGIICFQTIGMSTTFHLMSRKSDILTVTELTTIVLPKTSQEVVTIIAYIDDLYSMANLHRGLKKNEDLAPPPSPSLPYDYVRSNVRTVPRTRRVSHGAIASSSKH